MADLSFFAHRIVPPRLLEQEIFLFGNGLQLTDLSRAQLSFAYAPVDVEHPNAGLIGRTEKSLYAMGVPAKDEFSVFVVFHVLPK
jgi:hypothetical protein